MKFISVSEAQKKFTHIVSMIEETKEEVIITKKGKPVVLIKYISEKAFRLNEDHGGRKDISHGEDKRNL